MKHLYLIVLLLASVSVSAQKLKVFDIAPGPTHSGPSSLHVSNDKMYFYTVDNGFTATSLRSIDKNDNIVEIKGVKGAAAFGKRITSIGVSVFFAGIDQDKEEEIYGLKNGITKKLADQNGDTVLSTRINNLTAHLNKLYYVGRGKNSFDRELYVTDPAKNTTKKITDSLKTVNHVFAFKDRVYFTARTSTNGVELYTYDPQIGIYWLLHETAVGSASSNPKMFLVDNGKLYYTAYNGSSYAIYEYDGSFKPTMLTNSARNSDFATLVDNPNYGLKMYNNALHFFYHDTLGKKDVFAKYDMTTQKVDTIAFNPGHSNFGWYSMIVFNNKLFISGGQFWSYDTTKGVSLVDSFLNGSPNHMTVFNNYLYFSAQKDTSIGFELYRYNDSTTSVEQINNGLSNSLIYPNPTRDIAHLQFDLKESKTLNITLADMQGRLVYRTGNILYGASKQTVDLPTMNLSTGIYIYNIQDENSRLVQTGRLIKQ